MNDPVAPEMADASRRERLTAWIDRALEAVGVCGFVLMMLATLLQVAARHLHVAIDWTEELARILFLASIMIGIAIAIPRRQHIVVDFIYAAAPRRAQTALSVVFDLAMLVLLIVWLRGAWRLMELNAGTTFVTVPWLPVSFLYGVEALGVALMIVFVLADMAARVQGLRARSALP
jgi:TRAP-type C4-dicarboxylate transport system permease small subunit